MKKYWKLLLCAALGAWAFTACEDVPAPYNIPTENQNVPVINKDLILNQTFTSSLGDFESVSESGTLAWTSDARYGAIITGYQDFDGDGNKENKPGVTYLYSPEIDLTDCDSAYVIIEQAINYAKTTLNDDHKLYIAVMESGQFEELPMSMDGLGNSFTYLVQNIQIPQQYIGQKIQLALKHAAHDSYSSTWEVKSLKVAKGTAPEAGQETPIEGMVGSGTKDDPYDVPSTIKLIAAGPPSTKIYTKGIVSKIDEIDTGNFGNATYYISNDGTTTDQLEVYRGYGLGGAKFKSTNDLKVGDEVIVYGQVVFYNNKTMEFTQGSEIYSLNGVTAGGGGETPTEGIEVTCAEAVQLTNALADGATSTETYTITGYITEVIGDVSRNQQTFWMADTKDGGRVFEAYWANLPEGVSAFKKGSKVKITGQLMKYVNANTGQVTPEIKNATVVILEEGGDTPTPQPTGKEVTCAQAVELTNALADGATSTETYTVTGYITEVVSDVSRNQQTFWMADTKDGGHVFEAYWANLPEGVSKFTVGSKVKITGQLMKYVNKSGDVTPEIKNANVVILEGGSEEPGGEEPGGEVSGDKVTPSKSGDVVTFSGFNTTTLQIVNDHTENKAGTQLRIVSIDVTYADGSKESAVMANLGLENAATLTTHTLGSLTFSFAQGESTNPPKYYNSGTAARMYAKNALTITGKKAFTSVVLNCATGGYTGNELLYGIAAK